MYLNKSCTSRVKRGNRSLQVVVTVSVCSTSHTTGSLLACKHTKCMIQGNSNKPLRQTARVCRCCLASCTRCVCKLTAVCIILTGDHLLPEIQQALTLDIPTTVWVALLPAARVTASLPCCKACSYATVACDHNLLACKTKQDTAVRPKAACTSHELLLTHAQHHNFSFSFLVSQALYWSVTHAQHNKHKCTAVCMLLNNTETSPLAIGQHSDMFVCFEIEPV